jgi:hypothetical protein
MVGSGSSHMIKKTEGKLVATLVKTYCEDMCSSRSTTSFDKVTVTIFSRWGILWCPSPVTTGVPRWWCNQPTKAA